MGKWFHEGVVRKSDMSKVNTIRKKLKKRGVKVHVVRRGHSDIWDVYSVKE